MTRFFAELDENDIVISVLVVDDKDCLDENGEFSESVGIEYLRSVGCDGTFLESREDGSVRRFRALIGGRYLRDLDEFRPPQPEGWIWDDDLGSWVNPNKESQPDER